MVLGLGDGKSGEQGRGVREGGGEFKLRHGRL